jgi:enamine deaminase RidA (YjgF/YER057c/UK114 family)
MNNSHSRFLIPIVIFLGLIVGPASMADGVEIRKINPPTLVDNPQYTHVTTVSAGMKLVFVAGQIGRVRDDAGDSVDEHTDACLNPDMREQYMLVMKNVETALAAGGATWDDVVYIRKFTTDMQAFLDVSHDMPTYWNADNPPSSTLIGVASLADPCLLVEVDVLAIVDADS